MFRRFAVIGLCLGSLAPTAVLSAPAQKPRPSPSLDLDRVRLALESGDESRALEALDQIELALDPRAATVVDALLTRGANRAVLLRAIGVSSALGKETSSQALAPYVKHRAPDVRRAAARALAHTKGRVAASALREALRGNDPELRSVAAEGLGALGAKEAVTDLFVVLPHEVPEAAAAIGNLCSEAECDRFVGLLGRLPFEEMESGFLPLLLRAGNDVPETSKLHLIEELRRMATQKASALLSTALASYPPAGDPRIKTAIDAALHGHSVPGSEP